MHDETQPVHKPVDILEEGKNEDERRKFMVPFRPHEMIWNFIYDDEKKRPKHVMRPDSAPQKCYIDGRIEKLVDTIDELGQIITAHTPERWDKLLGHVLEIFVAQEKDESSAYEKWASNQQNWAVAFIHFL